MVAARGGGVEAGFGSLVSKCDLKAQAEAPKRHIKEYHRKELPWDPGSSKNKPKPIGNQSWKVALRPGTAGKTSNPVPRKYSFMFVRFSEP